MMAETGIEWTDATWNPVAGCSLQSAGCTHCYAMQMARRLEAMGIKKYKGLTRHSGGRTRWTGDVRLDESALDIPLRWRTPRKIFVNSMSDLFHEKVPQSFVRKVWTITQRTPRHHYQILTKRPDRMADIVEQMPGSPLANVWLGTSVENCNVVDRINDLKRAPAAIRFLSFEPLIGPVGRIDLDGIHWAIVGGESGPRARPIKEAWIDEIYEQCGDQSVAFFFKQWGTWGQDTKKRSKKANGREYRGRLWNEMPGATAL